MDPVQTFRSVEDHYLEMQSPSEADILAFDQLSKSLPLRSEERLRANSMFHILHIRSLLGRIVTRISADEMALSILDLLNFAFSELRLLNSNPDFYYTKELENLIQLSSKVSSIIKEILRLNVQIAVRLSDEKIRIFPHEYSFHIGEEHSTFMALTAPTAHSLITSLLQKKNELHRENIKLIEKRIQTLAFHQVFASHIFSLGFNVPASLVQAANSEECEPAEQQYLDRAKTLYTTLFGFLDFHVTN